VSKLRIFLSAGSAQFRDCRSALASDLRAAGAEVKVQEDFQQHGRTLLEKLEAYIGDCDRVIALVGDAYGYEPPEGAQPAGRPQRSYTQWEYFFALGERLDGSKSARKDIYIYQATDDYLAGHPPPTEQTPEQAKLQQDFLAAIHSSGEDRNKFGSLHELCRLALRDGFQVRDAGHKPCNLPLASIGRLFKGREAFLDDLQQRLGVPGARATAIVNRLAVHGLGGVGKTRAALEYAWRHADDYTALLFLSAPSLAELRANLANLVGVLGITVEATSVDQQLAEVLRWLDAHPGWLLIIDNVDTPEAAQAVEELLDQLRAGHALITSRIGNWSAGVEPLDLDVLAATHAAAFLLERTPHRRQKPDDEAVAALIAGELDGLALALEQAGANIDRLRLSFGEYLEQWEAKRPEVLKWHDLRLMKYPASVAVTWETTFAELTEPERRLLEALAWLAPEPIPLLLFDAAPLMEAIPEPREALAGLAGYSLARFDAAGEAVLVHRLVQEIARQRQARTEPNRGLRIALDSVNAIALFDADDVRAWPVWTPLAPHAAAVTRHSDGAGLPEPTARLMDQLGVYLNARCQFPEAERLYRRALAIDEHGFGRDHPDVARDRSNLAGLLHDTNRLGEAERLYRRALAIDEHCYGPDHPKVATDVNNLASLLQDTSRQNEAEPLYRRALTTDEQTYGRDHPAVARDLDSLAELLRATNRLCEAEPLYRRALAIDEHSYGLDHPKVARHLNNLAVSLHVTNRLNEAEPLIRRALVIDEHTYGPNHPNVAIPLNNLALLLKDTNRLGEAEPIFRRALAIAEQSYGPDHPDVARGLNNLASLLEASDRLDEAEPLYRRALAIAEQSYGPHHPNVATALNNLSALLQATNRLNEAEPHYHRAIDIFPQFRRSTGHEHPFLRTAIGNFSSLLEAMRRTPEQIEQRLQKLLTGPLDSEGS
jgi:tetratricopeptide (TPR) repeat protein